MRRLTAVVASGLLLVGVVLTSPAAYADHSSGLDDFKLTGEFTDFDFDDTGKDGPSKGDTVTFAMDLVDEDGDEAGDGEGTCELTKVNRKDHEFSADCESVFHLDDGDLEMEGEVTDEDFKNKEVTQDITGGSDDYDDASGTVTFTPADDEGDHHGHRHSSGYEAQHAGSHGGGGHGGGGHGGGGHGGGGHGGGGHGGGGHGDHKVDIDVDFD